MALLPNALLQNLSPRRCSSKQSKQPTSKAHPRFGRRGREENFYCRKCSSNSSNVRSLPSLADAWKKKPKAPHPLSLFPYILILFGKRKASIIFRRHSFTGVLPWWMLDRHRLERKERKEQIIFLQIFTMVISFFYWDFWESKSMIFWRNEMLWSFVGNSIFLQVEWSNINLIRSSVPCRHALISAVSPLLFLALKLMVLLLGWVRSNSTTSICPDWQADIKAVYPWLFLWFRSICWLFEWFKSNSTTSFQPWIQAYFNVVLPPMSVKFKSMFFFCWMI